MPHATSKERALELLRRSLNDPAAEFRDGQWEAIEKLVGDRARLLVVQRTGWGKSVVYFIAARLLRDAGAGPTLIVSPLLSLMRNQLDAAARIGVRAATINSSNTQEWEAVKRRVADGNVDVLLISPERLANDEFRRDVLLPLQDGVGLLVVDEAHCISDWGHDFRPDYRRIKSLIAAMPPGIPILATTATANDRVVEDVKVQLGADVAVLRGPLARPSLRLQNIVLPNAIERLAWLAEQVPRLQGSGIIYTLTVRDAERVTAWLRTNNVDAHAYHGSLDGPRREELEQRLLKNELKVLVATTALGMGFDKPDLGFVIHFQRPGSVVHYYQQVGRAGRGTSEAYGVLLGGEEDDAITDYFIAAAQPAEADIDSVLDALDEAEHGLTVQELEAHVNLSHGQIERVLKMLSAETPAPVVKAGSKWTRTAVAYRADREKIEQLKTIRRAEQDEMREYLDSGECLMQFLARALDDPDPAPCGVCAVCAGRELVASARAPEGERRAVEFLRRSDSPIEPRKRWAGAALHEKHGWRGNIAATLRAEPGRALALWGDPGWGELVRRGKQHDDRFDDELVAGVVQMIRERWRPTPVPTWVTAIPSLRHPTLVPDFARRLADALELPFVAAVRKTRDTMAQKSMQNSLQQANNIAGAFEVDEVLVQQGPALLVDDMVDSGWTYTVVAALLREAGSGPVFPMALAITASRGGGD